uniref:Uncharacterized protein n=1 Tax=Ditylenchus dipsaci TaxID=166011 RepID=A0A915DF37_9BILA
MLVDTIISDKKNPKTGTRTANPTADNRCECVPGFLFDGKKCILTSHDQPASSNATSCTANEDQLSSIASPPCAKYHQNVRLEVLVWARV